MEVQPVKEKELKFTNSWWNNFNVNTNNFTSHHVNSKAFSSSQVDYIRTLVENIIKKVTKNKDRQNFLRIWSDGKYEKNPSSFFAKHSIQIDETIHDWKIRSFQNKEFGLFLNYAETHCEELSSFLSQCIQPYSEQYGIPTNGISSTIILGDYGWTPLGVHRDRLAEYIVHFHLGPGDKDIYVWNQEQAKKLGFKHGEKVNDFDQYLKNYSKKYSFSTGDIFSMPGKCVHIGNTNSFSIGLVLEFNGLTEKELLDNMWYRIGKELFSSNYIGQKAKILSPYREDNHEEQITEIQKGIKYHNIDTKNTLDKAFKNKFKDHTYKLLSNNGFTMPPHINKKQSLSKFKKLSSNSNIKITSNRKILFYTDNKHIITYIRGEKISLKQHKGIIPFFNSLNKEKEICIANLKTHFFNDWSDDAINKLIYLLYKYKGIQFQL